MTTDATDRPFVNLRCYQGSDFVYDHWAGFFEGALFGRTYQLASQYWTAGAATCSARLVSFTKRGSEQVHATLGFEVLP